MALNASKVPFATLNSGKKIPLFGLGTWQSKPGEVGAAVRDAIEIGYRHFDCAAIYGNEKEIGEVFADSIKKGTVKREDLFVTSKLWNTNHHPDNVEGACKKTLKDLQLDYLDLYLIHWPISWEFTGYDLKPGVPKDDKGELKFSKVSIQQTWQAMEKLVDSGLAKSIGVSNFTHGQILDMLAYAKIVPAVNQIELHPYLNQKNVLITTNKLGVHTTSYTTLAQGKPLKDPVIISIAEKHKKTPTQIVLRWAHQYGISIIPKSVHKDRLAENMSIFDFELSNDEMSQIGALNKNELVTNTEPFFGWNYWPF